jgi:hypothetical protein
MRRPNCAFSRSSSSLFSSSTLLLLSSLSFHDQPTIRVTKVVAIGSLAAASAKASRASSSLHAIHLIEHLARLNLGNVVLRITLTVTHADFGRFLRDRLVRENTDPDTTTTLDVPGHGTTSSFDLTSSQTTATVALRPQFTERDLCTARRQGRCSDPSAPCGTFCELGCSIVGSCLSYSFRRRLQLVGTFTSRLGCTTGRTLRLFVSAASGAATGCSLRPAIRP